MTDEFERSGDQFGAEAAPTDRRKGERPKGEKNPNMKRTEPKTSPRRIAAMEKQVQALELRKAGATFEQIGKALAMSPQNAYASVDAALKRLQREPAEQVLALELERLDAMLIAVFKAAKAGDLQSINSVLAIQGRRTRYLGLDAPVKSENKTDLNSGGVLVIGATMTPEEWDAQAKIQQDSILRDSHQDDGQD